MTYCGKQPRQSTANPKIQIPVTVHSGARKICINHIYTILLEVAQPLKATKPDIYTDPQEIFIQFNITITD